MEVQTRAADVACSILRRERSNSGNGGTGRVVRAAITDGQEKGDETLSENDEEDEEGQDAGNDSDEFMTADESQE